CVTSTRTETVAAVSIGAGLALRKRDELLGLLRPHFARTQPWLQAGKYVSALASELPRVNGWSIARHGRDRTPDPAAAESRELGHVRRDERGAPVRGGRTGGGGPARQAAGRAGDRRDRRDGAGKAGQAAAGVKRQYLGCAGRQRDQHRVPVLRAGR